MGILTFPLVSLGANTVLAYNFLLLGLIWGAGMAVYALCWYLFREAVYPRTLEEASVSSIVPIHRNYRWIAAVTAGLLYGFNFYIFSEIGVLQLLATLFPPLTLLGLHKFLDGNRKTDALFLCMAFLGCWYTCGYYGLFLSVFVVCFAIKFGYRNVLRWKFLIRYIVVVAVMLFCLAPLIVGMQSAKTAMALSRPTIIVQNFIGFAFILSKTTAK